MTKTELITASSVVADMPTEAVKRALDAIIETIIGELIIGNNVSIPGFGIFCRKHRNARNGRNPKTGESMTTPACEVPAFKPGKRLKEAVNN